MTKIMKSGVAQIASVVGKPDANVEIHLDWIAKAREKNLDMLVFPELSLVGHYGAEKLLDIAMRRDDPRLRKLSEAAGDMWLVVGFIEEGPAAQFYNATALLHKGKPVYVHRKINIPTYGKLEEGKHYASGRFVDTHALAKEWQAGLLICADVWNPALVHLAFLHGATMLITPISSGVEAVGPEFDNPGGWQKTVNFYSMMYGAPTIMANRCGTEKDLTFWGGSCIVDSFGKTLAQAGDGEELISASLNYDDLRKARYLLPTVRDSNIALVRQETDRLLKTLGIPEPFSGDN